MPPGSTAGRVFIKPKRRTPTGSSVVASAPPHLTPSASSSSVPSPVLATAPHNFTQIMSGGMVAVAPASHLAEDDDVDMEPKVEKKKPRRKRKSEAEVLQADHGEDEPMDGESRGAKQDAIEKIQQDAKRQRVFSSRRKDMMYPAHLASTLTFADDSRVSHLYKTYARQNMSDKHTEAIKGKSAAGRGQAHLLRTKGLDAAGLSRNHSLADSAISAIVHQAAERSAAPTARSGDSAAVTAKMNAFFTTIAGPEKAQEATAAASLDKKISTVSLAPHNLRFDDAQRNGYVSNAYDPILSSRGLSLDDHLRRNAVIALAQQGVINPKTAMATTGFARDKATGQIVSSHRPTPTAKAIMDDQAPELKVARNLPASRWAEAP